MDRGVAEEMARRESHEVLGSCQTGIYRSGRRTRILLGKPVDQLAEAHMQVFTWFTGGRDWVRVEIRHVTDGGMVIQTAVDDTEMDPAAALTMATQLAGRYGIRFVYFQDALPVNRPQPHGAACHWQVCIR